MTISYIAPTGDTNGANDKTRIQAALIAASAVHSTAEHVNNLIQVAHQATEVLRVIAKQYPEAEKEIDAHCDVIDQILGKGRGA